MIYKILLSFDEIYDKMDDRGRRELIKCMLKEIKLYLPEEQKEQGHAVKSIVYSFGFLDEKAGFKRVNNIWKWRKAT